MSSESFSGENAVWTEVKLPPWWLVLIEGILLIILGIFLFANPFRTVASLVWVLGLYWLVRGVIDLVSLIWDRSMWGWKIFAGILSIVAGWIILQNPISSTAILGVTTVWILGFIGIFIGISSLIRGFKGAGWGTLILGVIEIILGILILSNTLLAATMLPWVLGTFAIFGGIMALFGAFRVRSVENQIDDARNAAGM